MKSHYTCHKELHSCIEIAFLSNVNPYDTVRQLSSLCQLCVAFMLLLHATCHMSHGAYSSGIVCLIACFRFVLAAPFHLHHPLVDKCAIHLCSWFKANTERRLPATPPPPPSVWHALKFNILTACTISSWNFCFITPRSNFFSVG